MSTAIERLQRENQLHASWDERDAAVERGDEACRLVLDCIRELRALAAFERDNESAESRLTPDLCDSYARLWQRRYDELGQSCDRSVPGTYSQWAAIVADIRSGLDSTGEREDLYHALNSAEHLLSQS